MTESIKFGPEWLRNTVAPAAESNTTSAPTAPLARYPLAEFRYGREEMLSLFDKNFKLPEVYAKYKRLFVDKIQCPLALTPSTEDERIWPTRPSSLGMAGRGRGGSVDRGRGRARGMYHPSSVGYSRSSSMYDEDSRAGGGRGWLERNGGGSGNESGSTDWKDSSATTSPRKEFPSRSAGVESWRRTRADDDAATAAAPTGNDWRSGSAFPNSRDKWNTRSSNWREEDSSGGGGGSTTGEYQNHSGLSRSYSSGAASGNGDRGAGKGGSSSNSGGQMKRRPWDGHHDDVLPEWATEDPSDYGGSFDASGAFHDSDDDDHRRQALHQQQQQQRVRRQSTGEKAAKDVLDEVEQEMQRMKLNKMERERSESSSTTEWDKKPSPPLENDKAQKSGDSGENRKSTPAEVVTPRDASPEEKRPEETPPSLNAAVNKPNRVQNLSESSVDHMAEVAGDMVNQLINEDEYGDPDANMMALKRQSNATPILAGKGEEIRAPPPHLRQPIAVPGADMWYYQDPQNKVQGPFNSTEMSEWYKAGYFDETLLVRRGCDARFSSLGDLLKLTGNAIPPFLASHLIPPMGDIPMAAPHQQPPAKPSPNPLLTMLSGGGGSNNSGGGSNNVPGNPGNGGGGQGTPNNTPTMPTEADIVQLNYQLANLRKQYMFQQQQFILQKLAATEPWNLLNPEQQLAMINHHMSKVTLPDGLLSVGNMTALSTAQLQQQIQQQNLFQSQLPNSGQSKMVPPQTNNVPSSLLQQQQRRPIPGSQQQQPTGVLPSSAYPQQPQAPPSSQAGQGQPVLDSTLQLINSISLNHLVSSPHAGQHPLAAQQPQQPPPQQVQQNNPQPKPPMIENDHIKSLILQLSMQKNNQMAAAAAAQQHQQQQQQQVLPKPNQPPLVDPLAGLQWNQQQQQQPSTLQSLLQPSVLARHLQPTAGLMGGTSGMDEMEMRAKAVSEASAVQWTPKSAASSLLSMWEMPPIKTPQVPQQNSHVPAHPQPTENKTEVAPPASQLHGMEEAKMEPDAGAGAASIAGNAIVAKTKELPVNDKRKTNEKVVEERAAPKREPPSKSKKLSGVDEDQKAKASSAVTKGGKKADLEKPSKKELDERKREAEERKRLKELKKRQAEDEKKRQADELKRKQADEKKRLEELQEQQRKAKLLEAQRRETMKIQEQQRQTQQQQQQAPPEPKPVTKMAPWCAASTPTGPSLAEIQKAEREKRAEQMRVEQALREQQHQQQLIFEQQQKEAQLKWNAKNILPAAVKSLAEIQAEEHAKQTAAERELAAQQAATTAVKQREKKDDGPTTLASIWSNAQTSAWNTGKVWGAGPATSGGGFWEDPAPKKQSGGGGGAHQQSNKVLAKSQTMAAISTAAGQKQQQHQHQNERGEKQLQAKSASKSASNIALTGTGAAAASGASKKRTQKEDKQHVDGLSAEFTNWCTKSLTSMNTNVDIPTFVGFLQDIESPFEVKDYIRMYLGETKECIEFSKQFLERRSKLKNQQRAQNAHVDDMCSPAPAITPSSNDFQEVKNKNKKVKKNKMMKLDNRILGFSVTAAPENWNLEKNLDNASSS